MKGIEEREVGSWGQVHWFMEIFGVWVGTTLWVCHIQTFVKAAEIIVLAQLLYYPVSGLLIELHYE